MCDASYFAVGAVLGQRKEGKPYMIYYASKLLDDAQINYTTTKKRSLLLFMHLTSLEHILLEKRSLCILTMLPSSIF